MIKYLFELINGLNRFESGMISNAPTWVGQSETEATVKAKRQLLEAKETEITNKKEELSVLYAEARDLKKETDVYLNGLINLAKGLHTDTPEKLVEYGIPPEKPKEPTNPPTMALTVVIKDDTDGEGFILSLQAIDPLAKNYLWEKGVSTNPSDLQTIPAMHFHKLTTRSTFVDDDVVKGSRYWYRVRAANSKGEGPWSEPTSKVQ